MRGLRKKDKRGDHEEERPVARKSPDAPPPLMLLLPDAGGIATYSLNRFPSAKAAEFFLDSTLRGQLGEGSVLFWALTREPMMGGVGGVEVEPLVIIRDVKRPIVYPFSFADLDAAHDFIRHEMRRGLDLGQVMVYWAVPARIEVDFWGRSSIIPPAPPSRHADTPVPSLVEFTPAATVARQLAVEDTPAGGEAPVADAPVATIDEDSTYLSEADIAEAVKLMEHFQQDEPAEESMEDRVLHMPTTESVAEPPVELDHEAEVIDFPSASQKLHDARNARAIAQAAWDNFSRALDEALDAYVVRMVGIKLAWNRIGRAITDAYEVYERKQREEAELAEYRADETRRATIRRSWANTGVALHEAVGERKRQVGALAVGNIVHGLRDFFELRAARKTAAIAGARVVFAALATAANAHERRKGMRKAWLNAAWTLEEAVYAHALEQKARAIRAWRHATIAMVEAAETQIAYYAALRVCWANASLAIGEGIRAHYARLDMFQKAWAGATRQVALAVLLKVRISRQKLGAHNFTLALGEALDAHFYHEEMIATWGVLTRELVAAAEASFVYERAVAAWDNIAFALDGVCRAYVRKQKQAIRAWDRLADAFAGALEAKSRQDAAISAWTNASMVLGEYAAAKNTHDAAVAAWRNATFVIVQAVRARIRYEGLVAAWGNAGAATREAVVARVRHEYFCDAWQSLTVAFDKAVRVMIARQVAMERSWMRLTVAFGKAVHAKMFRDASMAAWSNATVAIGEMVSAFVYRRSMITAWTNASTELIAAVPHYFARQRAIAAWSNAGVAFKEAVVAEAKMRIAEAGLDRSTMADVEKTVKAAQKAVKEARAAEAAAAKATSGKRGKHGKHAEPEVVAELVVAEAPVLDEEQTGFVKLRHSVAVASVAVVADERAAETAEEVVAEVMAEEVAEEPAVETEPDTSESAGGWRIHDGGRWEPREEPFRGFQSPPGRFYRKEREDHTPF